MSPPHPALRSGGRPRVGRSWSWGVALLLACAGAACRRPAAAVDGEAAERGAALALIQQQQYDAAVEHLGEKSDPESLYLIGLAWAGKARAAPLPTPGPGAVVVSQWKPEERRALEFLERTVAARPDHAAAHLAIAELVAPHALARVALERTPLRRPGAAEVAAPASEEPDSRPDVVLRHLGDALQADTAGTAAAEALVEFATRAGRLAEADSGYQELLRRRREDAALLVRYGDFLAGPMQDPQAALSQYAQALMWRPDDAATRSKIAELHLRAAAEHLTKQEYAAAEVCLADARRAGAARGSPTDARLREIEQRLREIRGR